MHYINVLIKLREVDVFLCINFYFFEGVDTPKRKVSDNDDLLSCEAHLDKYFLSNKINIKDMLSLRRPTHGMKTSRST